MQQQSVRGSICRWNLPCQAPPCRSFPWKLSSPGVCSMVGSHLNPACKVSEWNLTPKSPLQVSSIVFDWHVWSVRQGRIHVKKVKFCREIVQQHACLWARLDQDQTHSQLTCGCLPADTPGVHLQHSLQHLLPPEQFKELLPRGRLKPYFPPTPKDLALEQQITSNSRIRCATCV